MRIRQQGGPAEYEGEGRRYVVDIDLEKFFDRVNHDMLTSRVAQHVGHKWVLKLIRRYLEADITAEGIASPRHAARRSCRSTAVEHPADGPDLEFGGGVEQGTRLAFIQ